MANRYLFPSSLSSTTWDTTTTNIWSAALPLKFTASCSGTTLTTVGSPSLSIGMTVRSTGFVSLGVIIGGSSNTWTVTTGGTYASQTMGAAITGASVPTISDDAFIPNPQQLSGIVTLTIGNGAACKNFSLLSDSRVIITGIFSSTWTIAGSFIYSQAQQPSFAGTMLFSSTTTGNTFSSTFSNTSGQITFNGVGGGWTFTSNHNYPVKILTLTNGSLDTNGYNLDIQNFVSNNSNTRILTLGASTINMAQLGSTWDLANTAGLTFNSGTSIIEFSGAHTSGLFAGGGLSYNTLRFTNGGQNLTTITGNNTFNALSIAARTSVGLGNIVFGGNQTIGNLTLSASSNGGFRTFLRSNLFGTTRTFTVSALTAGSSNVDFRDINIIGAASPISGTNFGDCEGNSGITFTAAKNLYWNLAGTQNWNANGWSLTSGGTPLASNFPLAQDTAVFDNAGSVTGVITINAIYNHGRIDMSNRTTAMTLATGTITPSIYLGWANGSGTTLTGTGAINFSGRGSMQLTSAAKTFTQPLTMTGPGGTLALQDAATTNTFTLTFGTLNLNDLVLTCSTAFSSANTNTRAIAFGTGNITCSGAGTIWDTSTSTGLTTTGTQLARITSAGAVAITVSSGTLSEANSISFNFTAGTYVLTLTAASTWRSLVFTGYAGTLANTAQTIYGDLTVSTGMTLTAGANAWTFASTSGTKLVTTNAKTLDFPLTFNGVGGIWQLQDNLTMGATRALALTGGTLNTNNRAVSIGSFSSTGASIRSLVFGGSTWTVSGSGAAWTASGSNLTVSGGGTINMTSATAKTFAGGGFSVWPKLNQGGAGALTISGSNRFTGLSNTVQPATITFTAGTTNFFNSFTVSGTPGNLVTLGSTSTVRANLQKPIPWYMGANSVNGGNNLGLTFTAGAGVDYLSASYINGSQIGAGPGNFFVFF